MEAHGAHHRIFMAEHARAGGEQNAGIIHRVPVVMVKDVLLGAKDLVAQAHAAGNLPGLARLLNAVLARQERPWELDFSGAQE
jgi:hypothetical protein